MLLQMALVSSFTTYLFKKSFLSQWTFRLLPGLGYYKYYHNNHCSGCVFLYYGFLPDTCPDVGFLDHMVALFLVILMNFHNVLHSGCTKGTYPQQCKRNGSLFFTPSPTFIPCEFFGGK